MNSGADAGLGILFFLIFIVTTLLAIGGMVFWIWALIDCASKEPNDGSNNKVLWLLLIIFTHFIGALLYILIRRPERIRVAGR